MNSGLPFKLQSGAISPAIKLNTANVKYTKCYFALLDILGFRSILETQKQNAPVFLYDIIWDAINQTQSLYASVSLKVLSDSILVWTSDDQPIDFWNLLNVVDLIRSSFFNDPLPNK